MRLLATLLCGSLLSLGAGGMVEACCAVAPTDVPAVNGSQTVILLWDKERQTEHFIRQASFRSKSDSVGFLVPTPSRPELAEAGNDAFPYLEKITAPAENKGAFPLSCSAEPTFSARGGVRVVEEKTVAGFHCVVLAADSGKALVGWLHDHEYAYTPEAAEWAEPYLQGKWYMTAMKISKDPTERSKAAVAASAVRISFQTDRPLFPYREPDSRKDAAKLGAADRLLRIYFVGESRYEGRFSNEQDWSGQPRWSNRLEDSQRSGLLRRLALPENTGPKRFWLTQFDDYWPYGKAPGDLYFSRSASQQTLARESRGSGFDPLLIAALGVVLARPLFRRNRR